MAETPASKSNEDKQNDRPTTGDPDNNGTSQSVKQKSSSGHIARFENKYFIDLSKELPQYSTPAVKAYSTGTAQNSMKGFFAVMCNPRLTPRTNITKSYMEIGNVILPKLMSYGRALMPDGTARLFYIYQDTLGGRIYNTDNDIAKGWKAERTLEVLVMPILTCLKDLQQRDLTHGNIRATNLYNGEREKLDKVRLGECLSIPASYSQPVIYEPVQRAMADPIGRGEGTIKDDLYALGVLMAMHMRNFDPLRGKTDEEIISAKVVHGSYGALVGSSDRLSSGITDLLRGLLTDNEKGRWSLEEVFDWLDGRRLTVNQSVKLKKAARGLKFDGTNFFYARTFAHRLLHKPNDGITIIENHELSHWVERSLSNNDMAERLNRAVSSAKEQGVGVGYADRLLPRVSIALDPYAPIRFKSMSLHLNSIGNAMADAFSQKKGLNNFVDLFNGGIIYFWISICADMNLDVSIYVQQFDKIKGYLRQKEITSGIERCLYFLNPSIHCLSPLVSEYFVTDPKDYLASLETIASQNEGKWPTRIIDKHAACFLVSRDARLIEPYIYDLSSDLDYRYTLANLKIMAGIQKFSDIGPLPHLTEWLCSLMDPIIERYHDKEVQKSLRREIEKKKSNGNLSEILKIIESPERIKGDQIEYRKAIAKFRELDNESIKLKRKLENPKFYSERTGREWAATISAIVSALVILGFIMVHYGTGSPF